MPYASLTSSSQWTPYVLTTSLHSPPPILTLLSLYQVPVVLSLTTSPFLLVASQTLSLLWLRPIYFLLAALAEHLDSMQQMLAVVLVLISLKIFAEAAGYEVPISLFLGVLVGWRLIAIAWTLLGRSLARRRAAEVVAAAAADVKE